LAVYHPGIVHRYFLGVGALVVAAGALASGLIAALGGWSMERPTIFSLRSGARAGRVLVGWAVLVVVFIRSRTRSQSTGIGALWLVVAAFALPLAAEAAVQLGFGLGGGLHH
jgi:hypothetical protein